MSWLRRLSRDRDSKTDQQMSNFRPPTSYGSSTSTHQQHHQPQSLRTSRNVQKDSQYSSPQQSGSEDMLTRQQLHQSGPISPVDAPRNYPPQAATPTVSQAPDLLTKAFNEALRPYQQQIRELNNQLTDAQDRITQLQEERVEIFAWIDKRGLRPDAPDVVAKAMDLSPGAAPALSQQLDRKLSTLDVDLHRLQDTLNDALPPSHYSTAFLSLLPDIERLASLPNGSSSAFDLILKVGGNFNDLGMTSPDTVSSDPNIARFYNRLDETMVGIVRRRLDEQVNGGEPWPIARDIRRVEKCDLYWVGAFGQKEYFTRTLEVMRYQTSHAGNTDSATTIPHGQGSPRTRTAAYDG